MSLKNGCGRGRGHERLTGADGVSVLPAAMVAALAAAGIAITRSVRKSRAAAREAGRRAGAGVSHRPAAADGVVDPWSAGPGPAGTASGPAAQPDTPRADASRASADGAALRTAVPSGQTAVRATVDDDGR